MRTLAQPRKQRSSPGQAGKKVQAKYLFADNGGDIDAVEEDDVGQRERIARYVGQTSSGLCGASVFSIQVHAGNDSNCERPACARAHHLG
jgi:hypothetical protein